MKKLLPILILLICTLPAAAQDSIRMMSWNVHNSIGTDGRRDFDRIAGVIREIGPDVAGLQELDRHTIRHWRDILGQIARRTGMHATFAPAIGIFPGKYGIGVLSREKPLTVKHIPLPGAEEKRVMLIVEFERYIFINVHFSLTQADRVTSARMILDAIKDFTKPVFLAGDINANPDNEVHSILAPRLTIISDPTQKTRGERIIDYIYGPEGTQVLRRQVVQDEISSDHRPLWVDVKL